MTLLGFASRAGKLVSGENTCKAKSKQIQLVILSEDAREDTKRFFANRYKGRCYSLGTRYELGVAIGKSPRTVIGVTERQFAKSIEESIKR